MAAGITRKPERGYGRWDPSEDGVTLTWRDVSVYTIVKENLGFCRRTKPTYKRIINDGAVKPGSLVAMLGASGAGKSTLMAALAYRNPAGVIVDGDIRVNGRPIGDYMHRLSGFMYQDDLFVSSLTAQEHLFFM
ncbi:protein scarlet-like, partial [Cryptotermes secundus]|uniref:protein scarlet-like n=1 Tax=Cryptotermes secundus TaxID=105785 RepID=UPI001454CE18